MLLLAVFDAWYLHQHLPVPGTQVSRDVKRNICRHSFGFIQWLTMHSRWLHIELAVAIPKLKYPKKSSPYTKYLHFLIYTSCLFASVQSFLSLKQLCLAEQQNQRKNWFKCQWGRSKLKSGIETRKKNLELKIFLINFVIAWKILDQNKDMISRESKFLKEERNYVTKWSSQRKSKATTLPPASTYSLKKPIPKPKQNNTNKQNPHFLFLEGLAQIKKKIQDKLDNCS